MCGIVGYLGKKSAVPIIVNSLRHLEYRGYDSAGVAFLESDRTLRVYKSSGKLINLENILPQISPLSDGGRLHLGIGHIRWATHGAPTDTNAHPHVSGNHEVAVVHNGIIENFDDIRTRLEQKGVVFLSETDTECVAHLIEEKLANFRNQHPNQPVNFMAVLQHTIADLKGAYALAVIYQQEPERLYAVRNHAPLVIGVGEGEFIVASDVVAVAEHTDRIVYLKDKEIAQVTPQDLTITTLSGEPVQPVVEKIATGPLLIDKKGFKHFMMKEIHEQPDVVRNSLSQRLLSADQPIHLLPEGDPKQAILADILRETRQIYVIGCGTSYHAGLVGKYFIEELVRVPVSVEAAGEFRYRNPILDKSTLILAISQSGETADTLEALRQSQEKGARVVCITNREDSTIARESEIVLPVRAGVEVSVCATKSFLAQIIGLYLIGLALAENRSAAPEFLLTTIKQELLRIPALIESTLSDQEPIQQLAKKYGAARDVLFIARGINFPVALEGALKLKEISYIHAEGYSGSELKHGPIAMLDANTPVVAVLAEGIVFDKMISNCQEAKARDAQVIGITSHPLNEATRKVFADVLEVPSTHEYLSPLLTSIPLQLLAYYMAEYLGKDVDQPRNLAKSVTVE